MAVPAISLLGLSHRTAPVAVRERYAFDEEGARAVLADLTGRGLREAVLLSTCNRTEVYGIGADGEPPPEPEEPNGDNGDDQPRLFEEE